MVNVHKNMIYDFQASPIPFMKQEILVVSSDRDEGLLFFNVDNCDIIATIKFGPKDDLYCQGII